MFEVIDLSPKVGSEIRIDRAAFVEGTHAGEIERLLVERSALVFREMFLTDEEQRQFASTIGEITLQGEEGVSKISMDPDGVLGRRLYARCVLLAHRRGQRSDPGQGDHADRQGAG